MLADWLAEYRRHPIWTGTLIAIAAIAIIVFAVAWTIRHTHELPGHPPAITKLHLPSASPQPTITITEQPPARTITAPPPPQEVSRPGTPSRRKSEPPTRPPTTPPAPTTSTPPPTQPSEPPPDPSPPAETSPSPTEPAQTTENPTGPGSTGENRTTLMPPAETPHPTPGSQEPAT